MNFHAIQPSIKGDMFACNSESMKKIFPELKNAIENGKIEGDKEMEE